MTDDVINRYRERVRNLIKMGVETPIDNASARHATVIINEMISGAQISFYAYARKMSKEVWTDDVLASLQDANSRSVSVRILVDDDCEAIATDRLAPELHTMVRRVKSAGEGLGNHFSVADGRMLRFETNPEKRTAMFLANNRKLAGEVSRKFQKMYLAGRPYARVTV